MHAKKVFLIVMAMGWSSATWAQDGEAKRFDGFYVATGLGFQNLFGGSFVQGVDILAQKSRFVVELSSGYRRQFSNNRWVAGVELSFGLTDGNLKHSEPANQLTISYKNGSQWGYGVTAGIAVGVQKKYLVFGYLNETTRNFDVTVVDAQGPFKQQDEQGMLKYGVGIEGVAHPKLSLRATIGRLRVDFGKQQTNINVEDKLDVMMGAVYQF